MLLGANGLFLAEFLHFIDEPLKIVDEISRVLGSQRVEHAFDFFLCNCQETGTHILQSSVEIGLVTYLQVVNQSFIGVQGFRMVLNALRSKFLYKSGGKNGSIL